MAIELATEVTFTPKPGSFLFGIDSDQFPGRPVEIMLGDTAPVPRRGRPGGRTPAPAASAERRGGPGHQHLPVGAGLSSSAAFSVALLLALGHDPDPLALARDCQEAERSAGAHVGLLDPLAIAGATAGHALHIDFATLETRQVAVPEEAAFVIVHSEAPRLLTEHSLRRPAAPSASGRRTSGPAARPLRARRPQRAAPIRSCAGGPATSSPSAPGCARPSGCWPAATSAGLGAVMTEGHRSLADDYRVSVPAVDELVEHLLGLPGCPRRPHERRRLRRVRHRAVRARLAGARPRDPRAAPELAGQPGCRRSSSCDVAISASSTPTARPLSMDSAASASPLSQVVDPSGHHERGRRVEDPDVAPGALLPLEHGADHAGVEGGVAAPQVGHASPGPGRAPGDPPATR